MIISEQLLPPIFKLKRFRLRKTRQSDSISETTQNGSTSSRSDVTRGWTSEFLSKTRLSVSHGRSPSPSPSGLGLHVIHQPDQTSINVIFVHGLGGHSIKTWSKNHDPSLFWPQLWLPFEPGFENARIFTFGYDAAWRGAAKSVSNVTDFAKELLFELQFGKDASGEDLDIRSNPIIFVVHSMGGLVTKKACLLGLQETTYQRVTQAVSAIVFLLTPHRGTHLAKILNKVLSASFQSSKNFISDLDKGSSAIEDLNEQFRHLAPKLSIWSFYETLATSIGPRQIMVLEKDSSVLGYPGEISRSLQADHHDVCKFSNPTDPKYVAVRNALQTLIRQCQDKKPELQVVSPDHTASEEMSIIQDHFRGCPSIETDYDASRRSWIPGTCEWFLQEEQFLSWLSPSSIKPAALWYTAPPANGKTVLSAFIINHLRSKNLSCHYYLFKYSDNDKRMVVNCIKSLAYQIAATHPLFRRLLAVSTREGLGLDSSDPFWVWKNIIEGVLFKSNITTKIYWVIDALDECDSPKVLLECLQTLADKLPVRILFLSRDIDSISSNMNRLSRSMSVRRIEKSATGHNRKDIEHLVQMELDHMRGSSQFRDQLLQEIMKRSEGNFLWVQLVLEEITGCHTEGKIREVLNDIPNDMTLMFRRMEQTLLKSIRRSDKPLMITVLEWSTCAQRPLDLNEMSQALQPEFSDFLDLKRSIQETCGQFVQVDGHGIVTLLHHTVREYFTQSSESQLRIDSQECHERLLTRTLAVFRDQDLRWRLLEKHHTLLSSEPFMFYAAVAWPFHLAKSTTCSLECLDALAAVICGPGILVWIHSLALIHRLEVLVTASQALVVFTNNLRRCMEFDPLDNHASNIKLLSEWATDLIKLVGRFSNQIVSNPGVLYSIIPAVCPRKSVIYQQFRKTTLIKVVGAAKENWSDNLCRLVLPNGAQSFRIECAGKYLAVLDSIGSVHIWDASNFSRLSVIQHGEIVIAFSISNKGERLCTYGLKTTKLWSSLSGELIASTANPPYIRVREMVFADSDTKVLLGGDDNVIRCMICDRVSQGWQILNGDLLKTTVQIDGALTGSPVCLAFNGDRTLVSMSYRSAPLYVWRLSDGACINVYKRADDSKVDQSRLANNWFAVNRFTWNRVTNHILGIVKGGWVFKWHPLTDERIEKHFFADEIAASPNGRLFATTGTDGSIHIWSFSHFSVIYELTSGDMITAIAFSPDSRRFHDLRYGTINTWESSKIIQFLETDEYMDGSGDISRVSESFKDPTSELEPVTAFSLSPDSGWCCVGYEDGHVELYRRGATHGRNLTQFGCRMPITNIQWSSDGCLIAISDLAADMQIWRLFRDSQEDLSPSALAQPRYNLDRHNIETFIFSLDGTRILIESTSGDSFVCSTEDGNVTTESRNSKSYETAASGKWLCHPIYSDVILRCDVYGVHAYSWNNLEIAWSSKVEDQASGSESRALACMSIIDKNEQTHVVKKTLLTHNSQHILLFTSEITHPQKVSSSLKLVPVTTLRGRDESILTNPSSDSLSVPPDVLPRILMPLGVLPERRLVFLDQDLWVCSYPLGKRFYSATGALYNRFYFIPRNWVAEISFEQCALADDGTLFWPRSDRVLLIECKLDETRLNSVF
ncbi:hypothetical protein F5Y08DRAFT_338715 [Xylaria arbuscula]|nr:hypothetical protein F5Y08DRAFT_338715 [Xylaria arbuscula]